MDQAKALGMRKYAPPRERAITDPTELFSSIPKPEIFWSDIPVSKTQEYQVLIYDICNPFINDIRGSVYWVYKVRLIKGFEEVCPLTKHHCMMHFSAVAFQRAWMRGQDFKRLPVNSTFDVEATFTRPRLKSMVFLKRTYSELRRNTDDG